MRQIPQVAWEPLPLTPEGAPQVASSDGGGGAALGPWAARLAERGLEFRVVEGANFAFPVPPRANHFAGVFAFHGASRCLHVEDTLMLPAGAFAAGLGYGQHARTPPLGASLLPATASPRFPHPRHRQRRRLLDFHPSFAGTALDDPLRSQG